MPPGPPTSLPPGLIPPGPPPGPPPKEAFRFNAVGYNKTEEPILNMQGIEHLLSWYKLLYFMLVYYAGTIARLFVSQFLVKYSYTHVKIL